MELWKNEYITVNKFTRPGKKLTAVRKIVLHWTANPGASAEDHHKYFNGTAIKNETYASAHLFVDTKEAICIIPLDEVAYHANDQYEKVKGVPYRGVPELLPNANYLSISVEMCVEKDGSIADATIERAAKIIAVLCKSHKLTENDIVRHYDITHKPCPEPFVDHPTRFEEFKQRVHQLLNPKPVTSASSNKDIYPFKGILKVGSKGEEVKKVQKRLNVKVDGIFGPNTEKALKEFQKKNKITVDGIVGKITWGKLF